jgi:aerobic carbon-monoxide dehydrogenase small subunit
MRLELNVNGREHVVDAAPDETLLRVLRDRLRLTGTKEGCTEGECGACTVMVGGLALDSCLYAAHAVGPRAVTTVEALERGAELSALQTAILRRGGVQCGFCTPGLLVMLTSMLATANGEPVTEAKVRTSIAGNICRCTGYAQIVAAVLDVVAGSEVTE